MTRADYVGRCRSISRVYGEYTDYTRSHHHPGAQFWVGSSRNWSVFLERRNTGRHEKAPVQCPCSRLAALHGAPRTQDWLVASIHIEHHIDCAHTCRSVLTKNTAYKTEFNNISMLTDFILRYIVFMFNNHYLEINATAIVKQITPIFECFSMLCNSHL